MGLRSAIGTTALSIGRSIGNSLGCELAVDVSGHSIETRMVVPGSDDGRAWDDSLYVSGNLFLGDYANPIKPVAEHNDGIDNPDEVTIQEAEVVETDAHVSVISSARYRMFMIQDLVSELLNPSERLTKIQWAIIGLAGMMLMTLVVNIAIAAAVGVF